MRYIFVKINIIIYLQVVELIPFLQHSQPKIPKSFLRYCAAEAAFLATQQRITIT
jgi:hypothetical protein